MAAPETAEVCIVGVGIAGISVACRLRRAGVGPLVAFEKGAEVGGTWSVNRYPGAACDVPAHLYSLSFSYDFDWSRNFATQAGAWSGGGCVWGDMSIVRSRLHYPNQTNRAPGVP